MLQTVFLCLYAFTPLVSLRISLGHLFPSTTMSHNSSLLVDHAIVLGAEQLDDLAHDVGLQLAEVLVQHRGVFLFSSRLLFVFGYGNMIAAA